MRPDLSSPEVTAALGEIYADLRQAGDQRRAVLGASAAVAERLPLALVGAEEFKLRGGWQKWRWFRAGDAAIEARAEALELATHEDAPVWILQWHGIDRSVLTLVEDAIICAGVVARPNDRLHDLILQLLREYPVIVGHVAASMENEPARQITLRRVLSRSRNPLPVEVIAAGGFAVR